jgi:hypothetical protein
MSPPNITENPGKENNEAHRIFANRRSPKSSSPTAAVEEDHGQNRELEEPHRTVALEGVEVDTRLEKRDGAIGSRPSTGAAPQVLQHLDQCSPSTTATVEGRTSMVQPPHLHNTQTLLCSQEAKGPQPRRRRPLLPYSPPRSTVAGREPSRGELNSGRRTVRE